VTGVPDADIATEAPGPLFDAVVVGTGFGGAVAACRLAQAGKKICVLERGRRYQANDFPRPAERPDHLPHTSRWAWVLDQGLWDIKDLQGTLSVQAAGYGGGSLVYANVHLRPPPQVFSPANGWPTVYTRRELDKYYDVVAAVLRVQPLPATLTSPSPISGVLPKFQAMQSAATGLHREQWFFKPPLAIDFKKCVMCGECIAGCQFQAKNTLDLNYLAAAERIGDVDVRTLAEVTEISQDADAYVVTYHDHATRSEAEVRAKSVFLCAGAVNSTHLLLRSGKLPMTGRKHIGARFFGNGDAIAMTYDTTPAPAPTVGPTITGTLLYNRKMPSDGTASAEWFLIQDGGYPKWLEPVLGLFRGEFWLGGNRISRSTGRPDVDRREAEVRREADALVERGRAMMSALIGLLDARRSLRLALTDVGARLDLRQAIGRRTTDLVLDEVLPRQILALRNALQSFLREREKRETATLTHATLDKIGEQIVDANHPHWLFRQLVDQAKEKAEPFLVPTTLATVHKHFLNAPDGTIDPFTTAVLWPFAVETAKRLFLGQRPDDHAFLMLAVGIDPAPGQLYLDSDGRLKAFWDAAANMRFTTLEERLMCDVAQALGGEMRLNPDSSARRRPVTVHNLGGCAMADDAEHGVTDPNGRVWGTRALYVLDGSAIPGPLGANPSATIAAIAERNVRLALADRSSPIFTDVSVPLNPPLPDGQTLEEIKNELGWTPAILDPIAAVPPSLPPPPPVSHAVGFKFSEVMEGFYKADGQDNLPLRAELTATIDDLSAFLVDPGRKVAIEGTVRLALAPESPTDYRATGTLELLRHAEALKVLAALFNDGLKIAGRSRDVDGESAFRLSEDEGEKRKTDAAAMDVLLQRIQAQSQRYEMAYDLKLEAPSGALGFKGLKTIRGGSGLAAWTQTTTVAVELTRDGARVPFGTGTMHVHLADFLRTQVPSFEITGVEPDDHVRIAWGFERFFRFFLGTLGQVYVPHTDVLDPFGDRRR
jgi:choline dehydrogenase-like flavoprotein